MYHRPAGPMENRSPRPYPRAFTIIELLVVDLDHRAAHRHPAARHLASARDQAKQTTVAQSNLRNIGTADGLICRGVE